MNWFSKDKSPRLDPLGIKLGQDVLLLMNDKTLMLAKIGLQNFYLDKYVFADEGEGEYVEPIDPLEYTHWCYIQYPKIEEPAKNLCTMCAEPNNCICCPCC